MRTTLALAMVKTAAAPAMAFPPLEREPVWEGAAPDARPTILIALEPRIGFAPGRPIGLHRRPASVVGIVAEDAFRLRREGEPPRILHTGGGSFEPAGWRRPAPRRCVLHKALAIAAPAASRTWRNARCSSSWTRDRTLLRPAASRSSRRFRRAVRPMVSP